MSSRAIDFVEGEYYHIYNRGNSKQNIFHDKQDYLYFMSILTSMNTEVRIATRGAKHSDSLAFKQKDSIVSIGAYCLMPNHFHIAITQHKDNGISKFLQKVSTAYVMYYNKKYKRTGSLFEGKFKSKYVGEDIYLKYLFSYIHLNPLKIIDPEWKLKVMNMSGEMMPFLVKYPYSSFTEYFLGAFTIVDIHSFPNYFPTKAAFIKDITSWFNNTPL